MKESYTRILQYRIQQEILNRSLYYPTIKFFLEKFHYKIKCMHISKSFNSFESRFSIRIKWLLDDYSKENQMKRR